MQRPNFLFERPELNQQPSVMLFQKREFSQTGHPNISPNLLLQLNLSNRQQVGESYSNTSNSISRFTTPPMPKKIASTPKAPIKHKKQRKKVDLKPKKLEYSEDETDIADSGVHVDSAGSLFYKQCSINCSSFDPANKQTRRLRTKLEKSRPQSNDKENDSSVIEIRSENASASRNNVSDVSSVASQCDSGPYWKKELYRIQASRNVGLWIECCNATCKKWRYVEDYHDPVDVPMKWYCNMNPDKTMASCNIPADPILPAISAELIENAYNAGSIVWAHIPGYPWWPGVVNDCPDTFTYYKLPKNSIIPIQYYVTFFTEDKLECAWVNVKNLKPFATTKYTELVKRTKYCDVDYKSSLDKAFEMALTALPLTILQRLEKFSFPVLYDKYYDANNNLKRTLDEIIPCSNPQKRYITLKDFYLNVIIKKRDAVKPKRKILNFVTV